MASAVKEAIPALQEGLCHVKQLTGEHDSSENIALVDTFCIQGSIHLKVASKSSKSKNLKEWYLSN